MALYVDNQVNGGNFIDEVKNVLERIIPDPFRPVIAVANAVESKMQFRRAAKSSSLFCMDDAFLWHRF